MYNDIWYYGTYLLEQNDRSLYVPNFDWPILQPFVGFRVSDDFGESWCDRTTPEDPLLENCHDKWVNAHGVEFNPYEVMIGAPHFVDFGQNLKYAPVDKATGRKRAYRLHTGQTRRASLHTTVEYRATTSICFAYSCQRERTKRRTSAT